MEILEKPDFKIMSSNTAPNAYDCFERFLINQQKPDKIYFFKQPTDNPDFNAYAYEE